MPTTLSSEQITEEVIHFAEEYGLVKNSLYKDLHSKVCNASKKNRYHGLIGVFLATNVRNKLLIQTFAGRMLVKIQPKCQESADEVLLKILDNWNVSAEEIVWYLGKQFGRNELINAASRIEQLEISDRAKAALGSFRFWTEKTSMYQP